MVLWAATHGVTGGGVDVTWSLGPGGNTLPRAPACAPIDIVALISTRDGTSNRME